MSPVGLDPVATLRRTDPAAGPVPDPPPLDVHVARVPGEARPRSRTVVLVAAVALIALVAAAAVVAVNRTGAARTDPAAVTTTRPTPTTADRPVGVPAPAPTELGLREPAAPALLALADQAEAELGPPLDDGPVVYTRTVGWRRLTGEHAGRVVPLQWETWTEAGEPMAWRESDGRAALVGDGALDPDRLPLPPEVEPRTTSSIVPVRNDPPTVEGTHAALGVVPDEPVDLFQVLAGVTTALGAPRTGTERALLFRALATVDGVEHRGPTTDRAGRPGTAFSVTYEDEEDDRRELVLILDAAGGALAGENVLLGDAPVATDYQALVTSARVDERGERPAT